MCVGDLGFRLIGDCSSGKLFFFTIVLAISVQYVDVLIITIKLQNS